VTGGFNPVRSITEGGAGVTGFMRVLAAIAFCTAAFMSGDLSVTGTPVRTSVCAARAATALSIARWRSGLRTWIAIGRGAGAGVTAIARGAIDGAGAAPNVYT